MSKLGYVSVTVNSYSFHISSICQPNILQTWPVINSVKHVLTGLQNRF